MVPLQVFSSPPTSVCDAGLDHACKMWGRGRNRVIHASASWFWVNFGAFPSVSWRGSYPNGMGRLSEYAKLGVCDFSTLVRHPKFVPVKFGDERLAGCCA